MMNVERAARALASMTFGDVDAIHEVDKHRPAEQRRKIWVVYTPPAMAVLTALGIDPEAEA